MRYLSTLIKLNKVVVDTDLLPVAIEAVTILISCLCTLNATRHDKLFIIHSNGDG